MRLEVGELTGLTAGLFSEWTFSCLLGFDPFPLHPDIQYYQATAQQVWPRMAVGLARPKASQHRHQQVGLEQRQRGFCLRSLRVKSNRTNRWDWRALSFLDRGQGLGALQGRRFFNTSRIASSSGLFDSFWRVHFSGHQGPYFGQAPTVLAPHPRGLDLDWGPS